VDNREKEDYDRLKNEVADQVEDNKLKSGVELAVRMEGEIEFQDEEKRKE